MLMVVLLKSFIFMIFLINSDVTENQLPVNFATSFAY